MELNKRREKDISKKEELLEEINLLKEELESEKPQLERKEVKNRGRQETKIIEHVERQIPSTGFEWAVHPEKYPWMYSMPSKNDDFEDWLTQWTDFTLQWFKTNKIHQISLVELMSEKPFSYLETKSKSLTVIVENLISKKFGEYTDKEFKSIRVFWRGYKDWGEVIYNWALKKGRSELTFFDVINLTESPDNFHMLPKEDFKKIFNILVKNKRAEWIKKKNMHIRMIF